MRVLHFNFFSLTLLYGVIRRRRVAVAVWVSFSLVALLVTVTMVTKSIAEAARALDAEYPDDDKTRKVATGKIIAVSILAAGIFSA